MENLVSFWQVYQIVFAVIYVALIKPRLNRKEKVCSRLFILFLIFMSTLVYLSKN